MMLASAAPPAGEAVFLAEDGVAVQWTVPRGVREICALCIGAGGVRTSQTSLAGAGGGLAWKNRIPVTPGETLTIRVGKRHVTFDAATRASTASYIARAGQYLAHASGGGEGDQYGTPTVHDGGGNGGAGSYGGGGAGGYSGKGGNGGASNIAPLPGEGGGGGGAYVSSGSDVYHGGGGVGLYGQAASGAAGTFNSQGGKGGSGGAPGTTLAGGDYGGGGSYTVGAKAGRGAVRIIWGPKRAFPSTQVDQASSDTVEIY
ncbi:hypothetical protein [Croceicoccus sp. YJ47]|uniref:glycine-rich domain-containing protein n=1 Tax=Croceicoccus sp. YJ47 TaxID=2798724 RepID=UPI001923AD92|nr:hypothetical protein [Croceicoccus sp. YJ47]QQN73167.1 hypothetical protein JD971_09830 [Croceicoccus sp. YJ47]